LICNVKGRIIVIVKEQLFGANMILKTYSRVFTNDAEKSLEAFRAVCGVEPHLRFIFEGLTLIGIGDILIVGGGDDALAPVRGSHGPFIVENLEETKAALLQTGAEITKAEFSSPTGRAFFARHSDGTEVEYVQWNADLVEKFIRVPQRNGLVSSQLQ
jgi:hypothetical protein